jgi:hypothetical protein
MLIRDHFGVNQADREYRGAEYGPWMNRIRAMRDERGRRRRALSLRVLAQTCTAGACPTVYESDRGTVVVQGYTVSSQHAGVDVPDGEALVEVPLDLLKEAVRRMS